MVYFVLTSFALQLFEVFDLDNSGTIDFDEFENMLKCMGHTMR